MNADDKSMPHLSPEECADKAIAHVLQRICEDSRVGWYLGQGTESFMLLTEALARLRGYSDVQAVREAFAPENPADPCAELRALVEKLQGEAEFTAQAIEDGGGIVGDIPVYGPHALSADEMREAIAELLGRHASDPHRCVREIAALFDAVDLPIQLLRAS